MANLTKPINGIKSTLKAGKGVRIVEDAVRDTVKTVKGDLGLSSKTDYGKFKSPGHKAYLDQWGSTPKIKDPGVKRIEKGIVDTYDT